MTTAAYALEPNDRWFYDQQDRLDARDALREEYEGDVIFTLLDIGKKANSPLLTGEKQCRDEALEFCFNSIFSRVEQQALFEDALLQIWVNYRTGCHESIEHRLAALLNDRFTAFACEKAHEKYR